MMAYMWQDICKQGRIQDIKLAGRDGLFRIEKCVVCVCVCVCAGGGGGGGGGGSVYVYIFQIRYISTTIVFTKQYTIL